MLKDLVYKSISWSICSASMERGRRVLFFNVPQIIVGDGVWHLISSLQSIRGGGKGEIGEIGRGGVYFRKIQRKGGRVEEWVIMLFKCRLNSVGC